jgi:ectoine hydroxylase-related dioxygenase (phytanoyl-CoA dioxygenase family)
MATPARTFRLSDADAEHYRHNGYVLFRRPVFDAARFARLAAIFEQDLARYGEEDLDTIHLRDPRLLEFLLTDEVLDLVEPIVGPDIGLWSSHFISKPPRTGKATPWHTDADYWRGRTSTAAGICTVWLALDEVTAQNGCMRVIPGSHIGGPSEYEAVSRESNIFGSQIRPDQIDERKAVEFELHPNECSLHEARIVHGATANVSERRRAGYTMRYFPTTIRIDPAHASNRGHKVWLARGQDRAGNVYES